MASIEVLDRNPQGEIAPVDLDTKLAQAMEQVLEEAERKPLVHASEKTAWAYRIPCAGVRYYTF